MNSNIYLFGKEKKSTRQYDDNHKKIGTFNLKNSIFFHLKSVMAAPTNFFK